MSRPSDPHARIDLLRAAEAVFVERGLDRAKVEDITDRAGRSKGSFYLHFESKEDAFRQIVEAMVVRLADLLEEEAGRTRELADLSGHTARGALMEAWLEGDLRLFEYLWQNRGLARLLFAGGRSASFGYLIDEFAERTRTHIQRALSDLVRAGVYRRDLEVELASLAIAGAYDRIAREVVTQAEKPPLGRWLAAAQRLFLQGMQSEAFAAGARPTRQADPRVTHAHAPRPSPARASTRTPTRPATRATKGTRR